MLHTLDAPSVRRWCEDGRAALAEVRAEIDGINVFPVPDGDTGTNLLLTLEAVVTAVRATDDDLPAVATALTRGALLGARGSSGVILSQLLRGVAEVLAEGPADGRAVARALATGVDLAYAGVAAPVEGTLLSVARAAADAARAAGDAPLAEVVAAACAAARAALVLTREQLAVLREAGVVDAGGRGWVVLLETLAGVVDGPSRRSTGTASGRGHRRPGHDVGPRPAARHTGPGYEVRYLLAQTTDEAVGVLREVLATLGDSAVVVGGGDGVFHVHVHVDDVGAALEAGIRAGRPSQIAVTRFADGSGARPAGPVRRAVVAGCPGEGLARLFRAAGALALEGAPSPAELLVAVEGTGATQVVLLLAGALDPTDAVAAAAASAGIAVSVVRTRSAVQVLSALAVTDPGRPFAEDVAAMAQAAASTRTAEVTHAVHAATTPAGGCRPGDALGVVEGAVRVIGADVSRVAGQLLEQLCGGAELVTVVLGRTAPDGLADRLRQQAHRCDPMVELVVIDGGQPDPPVLMGAE